MEKSSNQLLLLDNESVSILTAGTYKIDTMSFDEAKSIIEMFDEPDIIKCYTDMNIDRVIHDYLGIKYRDFEYKNISSIRVGQMGIIFKQYILESKTKPIVKTPDGGEAKKISNVYVYCEFITRLA